MALDERFMIAGPLNQYFVDKTTGLPLANGRLEFYGSDHVTPKAIYRLTGTAPNYQYIALPNPLYLSSVGTIVDNSNNAVIPYYKPFDDQGNIDLYYIKAYNSASTFQWDVDAWPNISEDNNITQSPYSAVNQISNSQFTHVNIGRNQNLVLTVSAASSEIFNIAPNWDLIISGSGDVTIIWTEVAGSSNYVTNPPYLLDITIASGITECLLRQKFQTNSGLWTSTEDNNIYLAGAYLAKNFNAGTVSIEMYYNESTGNSPTQILTGNVTNAAFELFTGISDAIPLSNNTDEGTTGYSEIYLNLPLSSRVQLTSIQVVPSKTTGSDLPQFDLISNNRMEAYLGDYYLPNLKIRHADSLLVGWDFNTNPAQIFGYSVNFNATAAYVWDQTICKRTLFDVAITKNSITGGMSFTNSGTNNAFYMMQYLDNNSIYGLLTNKLSVNVCAFSSAATTEITGRIYLFYGDNTATFPTLPTELGTLSNTGEFTVSALNWNSIPRNNLPTPIFSVKNIVNNSEINSDIDYGFNGWEFNDNTSIAAVKKLAIVVTFYVPDNGAVLTVNSISLVPNDVPARPIQESPAVTLEKCRYFYETSYPLSSYPGVGTRSGALIEDWRFRDADTTYIKIEEFKIFKFRYYIRKRASTPTVTFYSPTTGASGYLDLYARTQSTNITVGPYTDTLTSYYTTKLIDSSEAAYYPIVIGGSEIFEQHQFNNAFGTAPNADNSIGWFETHYAVDARLGVVT